MVRKEGKKRGKQRRIRRREDFLAYLIADFISAVVAALD